MMTMSRRGSEFFQKDSDLKKMDTNSRMSALEDLESQQGDLSRPPDPNWHPMFEYPGG